MPLKTDPSDTPKIITLVVPVFNEEKSVEPFCDAVSTLSLDPYIFHILFVDDGSTDKTVEVIRNLQKTIPIFVSFLFPETSEKKQPCLPV